MSFRKISFFLIVAVFNGGIAYAQSETDPVVQQMIEELSEDMPEDFDFSDLAERLNLYRQNPVEINKITRDQLHELFFLSPLQINAFLEHRQQAGNLIDLLELQGIEGFDLITVRRLLNFVYIGLPNSLTALTLKNLYQKGANDLIVRYSQYLQKQKGYLTSADKPAVYAGTPQKLLFRYRYYYGRDVAASLNMEKDAGERYFPGNKSVGFDFNSANIFVKNIGPVRKAVIGDYSLQFGQGLTLWSGLSFGKGAVISSLAKPALGLQPYKSANEALFLRGAASTVQYKFLEITPFLSFRKLDAGMDGNEITSMPQSGLHRTTTELGNKNSVSQTVYGANIRYAKHNLNVGLTAYQTRFSHPVQTGQSLFNQFYFSGSHLTNLGFNYGFTLKNTYLFGETAYSGNGGVAFINGLMSSISPKVSLVLLHRHYPKNYHSFFNQAVAEASNAVNETGFYSGLAIKPGPKWDVSVYSDFFRFPWLKFGVDAPSMGYELFAQVNYNPNKQTKWALRYKLEQKQENDDLDNAIHTLQEVRKQSYRVEFSKKINKNLTLRNRAELANYQKETQKAELGWMLYQDVVFDPMKSRYSGNMRLAVFNTPGFNSRIYVYENDVLFGYSVPAYQNKGLRFYLNGRYTFTRKTDLWLRYSISQYHNLKTIGSGTEEITGSRRSEIKLQLRYQF